MTNNAIALVRAHANATINILIHIHISVANDTDAPETTQSIIVFTFRQRIDLNTIRSSCFANDSNTYDGSYIASRRSIDITARKHLPP